MKKLKKKRQPADRDINRQHLGFAGTSQSSGTSPLWSQTSNMAPPSVPGPSSAQLQRPLTDNRQHLGFAGTSGFSGVSPFWSQTLNAAPPSVPGPSSAQPQRPLNHNAVFCRDNTRQHLEFAGTSGSSGVSPFWSQTLNAAPPSVPGPSSAQLQHTLTRNGVFCRWCDRCKSGM